MGAGGGIGLSDVEKSLDYKTFRDPNQFDPDPTIPKAAPHKFAPDSAIPKVDLRYIGPCPTCPETDPPYFDPDPTCGSVGTTT